MHSSVAWKIAAILAAMAQANPIPTTSDSCNDLTCSPGNECVVVDEIPQCIAPMTCFGLDCMYGTYCIARAPLDNWAECIPDHATSTQGSPTPRASINLPAGNRPPGCDITTRCDEGYSCVLIDALPVCKPKHQPTKPANATGSRVPAGVECGRTSCTDAEFCCNESCGICAPLGGYCIAQHCK